MDYTYKIVHGRKALDDLICRMKGKSEKVPETFDGFDTVYPASIALVPKIDES